MLSLSFSLPKLGWGDNRKYPAIEIPSVEIHDIEEAEDRRPRTLKHLVKANHANYSVLYHDLQYDNHNAHILGSAYLLGASSQQLTNIYEEQVKELEPWRDAPGEVTEDDWRDFLGKREYQRAFVDFFEDKLVNYSYDWKKLLGDFLFGGKQPLINNLIASLGHPLIHLGYAYELQLRAVAIEALALTSSTYNFMHKYFDDPSYTKPSTYSSAEPLDILHNIKQDTRFDGLFTSKGASNINKLFSEQEEAVLEHWNAWNLTDAKVQFENTQKTAVALLVGTVEAGEAFDFFVVHLLTTSHAVRVLLPLIPVQFHLSLVRQWWLLAITVYITQLRPGVRLDLIEEYDLRGRDWKFTVDKALNGPAATNSHFVKATRAMRVASDTWGDETGYYLKAAVKFTDEFESWGGFV